MVESPGTAPGSDPLITGAFIAIVRANPDKGNIGVGVQGRKDPSEKPTKSGGDLQYGLFVRGFVVVFPKCPFLSRNSDAKHNMRRF